MHSVVSNNTWQNLIKKSLWERVPRDGKDGSDKVGRGSVPKKPVVDSVGQ